MRLEAVRQANNAAVLRQQVFHFDPNYYPYLNAMGAVDVNANGVSNSHVGTGPLIGSGVGVGGAAHVNVAFPGNNAGGGNAAVDSHGIYSQGANGSEPL